MADEVDISFSIEFLPDELGIELKNQVCTMGLSLNHYWVYNKVDLSLGNNSLIPTSTSMMSKVDGGAINPVVDANDVVKFLYIKNRDTEDIYLSLDGSVNAFTSTDSIVIRADQSWFGMINGADYDDINAYVTSDNMMMTYAAIIQKVA